MIAEKIAELEAVKASMLRLRQDAIKRQWLDIAIMYGASALTLSGDILTLQHTRKAK